MNHATSLPEKFNDPGTVATVWGFKRFVGVKMWSKLTRTGVTVVGCLKIDEVICFRIIFEKPWKLADYLMMSFSTPFAWAVLHPKGSRFESRTLVLLPLKFLCHSPCRLLGNVTVHWDSGLCRIKYFNLLWITMSGLVIHEHQRKWKLNILICCVDFWTCPRTAYSTGSSRVRS
jgi:hypothetical protein